MQAGYIIAVIDSEHYIGHKFWTGLSWSSDIELSNIYESKELAELTLNSEAFFDLKNIAICDWHLTRNDPKVNWLKFNVISSIEFEHEQG